MMKFRFKITKIFWLLSIFLLFANCANSRKEADRLSADNGFSRKLVKGGDFWIATYQKITNNDAPYVFYIEGDGSIIKGRAISDDPTPNHIMLLNLAILDKRPNVVYLARPCQYVDIDDISLHNKCNQSYWTDARMSEIVVDSLNEVINHINTKQQKFSLIGFSGGGAIATLIATRNKNVKDILTIAANLDHEEFTKFNSKRNQLRPLSKSLNPVDYAKKINNIPQLHISGEKDERVPSFIADKYVKTSNSLCVHHKIFPNISHNSGWFKVWQEILNIPITCH